MLAPNLEEPQSGETYSAHVVVVVACLTIPPIWVLFESQVVELKKKVASLSLSILASFFNQTSQVFGGCDGGGVQS